VDESKRGDYVVVAAVVVPAELVSIRRELRDVAWRVVQRPDASNAEH
jgi:hypothetical protein